MKLVCGEKIDDSLYSGQCKDRVEAVMKNLCMVNTNDEKAAAELLYAVRFQKGMSQRDMGLLEGISKQAISQRIKKSKFMSELQKIAREQHARMAFAKKERKCEKAYRLYMSGASILEIQKQTGFSNPSQVAKEYAKQHNLPFVARRKGRDKKDKWIYELYMGGTSYKDMKRRTGECNPYRRAKIYAKRHNLPFEMRRKTYQKNKEN